jgi:hypothetical protein
MQFFYITDDNGIVPLRSFVFRQGQSRLIRIPTLGGDVFQRTRPEPDTFTMDATGTRQLLGPFRVVDSSRTVYECIGTNVNGGTGGTTISGIVTGRWQLEDADEAQGS